MWIRKRSLMLCVAVLLSCWWSTAMAVHNSTASNGTKSNLNSTLFSGRLSSVNVSSISSILKASRARNNHTAVTSLHLKSKSSGLGTTSNGSLPVNATEESKMSNSTTTVKPTHPLKHTSHRSNSSRLLDKFASKLSLVQLASSAASNQTSSARNERGASNVTLIDLKKENATERTNKTMEKRAIQFSNVTDKASSVIHTLPSLLANATTNVTNWAMRLIGFGDNGNSSSNVTAKVTRDTATAELKSQLNKTSANFTDVRSSEERNAALSNSSLLDHSSVVIKRETSLPVAKSNVSSLLNSTDADLSFGKSETKSNSSLKESTTINNRTRRQENEIEGRSRNGARPAGLMMAANSQAYYGGPAAPVYAPAAPAYAPAAPVYAPVAPVAPAYAPVAPVAPAYVPAAPAAPAYAPANAQASPVYGPMAPAYSPAAPAYGPTTQAYAPAAPAYGTAAPLYVPANPAYAPVAPAAPAAPVYARPTESYYTAPPPTMTTPAPYAAQPAPSSYSGSPYASMPSRPSATSSPWM